MKVDKLITCLNLAVDILSKYKGMDIESCLRGVLEDIESQNSPTPNTSKKASNGEKDAWMPLPKELKGFQLESMSISDIESTLNDKACFPTVRSLKELAATMEIATTARQNRNNIIHLIVKTIERGRIDSTLQSRRKETL